MKRPSFQFYPEAWQTNANLRRCSKVLKATWLDIMCLMHDSDEYGILRWPLKEVAEAGNCKVAELRELRSKTVIKGADAGETCAAFIYTPRHAGKDGEPVVLIPEQPGPIWYSSRMVRDEYLRSKRGRGTRFGDDAEDGDGQPDPAPKPPPNPPIGETPKPPPDKPPEAEPTRREGDGPLSLSLGSTKTLTNPDGLVVADAPPGKAVPDCPHERIIALYHELLPTNPRVEVWNDTRKSHMRARWRERAASQRYASLDDGLADWREILGYVARSRFLTGRKTDAKGKTFLPSLAWLVQSEKFARLIEGAYHDPEEAA